MPARAGPATGALGTLLLVRTRDLTTPALIVQRELLEGNLATMSRSLPGRRLRPHVKAHKCTALAARQADLGHTAFTCSTMAEMEGMARAGLGDDLLLANEVVDATRLGALVRAGARVTVAVDSEETIDAAASARVGAVLIDVNVGLPRCGCRPEDAGRLADRARSEGLEVRGVMGYEGHVVGSGRPGEAHRAVGGVDGTPLGRSPTGRGRGRLGRGDRHLRHEPLGDGDPGRVVASMDTAYAKLGLPFDQALSVLATVISVSPGWAVADCGLKALGHGPRGSVDRPGRGVVLLRRARDLRARAAGAGGDRINVLPAHVDPTVAYHEQLHLVDGDEVVESWPVDLRGW